MGSHRGQSDNQNNQNYTFILLMRVCSPGKMASGWIYSLCESHTCWMSRVSLRSLINTQLVISLHPLTCWIHSESSKTLRKESSESVEVALGAQALSSFLKEALTCRVSANSTGTSSQFRQESNRRPYVGEIPALHIFILIMFSSNTDKVQQHSNTFLNSTLLSTQELFSNVYNATLSNWI